MQLHIHPSKSLGVGSGVHFVWSNHVREFKASSSDLDTTKKRQHGERKKATKPFGPNSRSAKICLTFRV